MIKEYVGTKSKSQNSSHRKSIFISIYIDHESLKVREIYFETPVTGIWYNFIELEGVYTLLSLFVWLYSSIFTDWMFVYKPYISIFVGLFWLSMTALWKNDICCHQFYSMFLLTVDSLTSIDILHHSLPNQDLFLCVLQHCLPTTNLKNP